MRLAVYGTLREGEALSEYLDAVRQVGTTKIEELSGIAMYDIGPFPAAKITGNPNDKMVAEIIEADLSAYEEGYILALLDAVEGVKEGLYRQESIETADGEAVIYVFNQEIPKEAKKIIDWLD